MPEVLASVAAGLVALWGVAHAIATRKLLAGFDPITVDNRRVVLQEWLTGIHDVGAGSGGHLCEPGWQRRSSVTIAVYRVAAGLLVALAVRTGLTGARTPVVCFKEFRCCSRPRLRCWVWLVSSEPGSTGAVIG